MIGLLDPAFLLPRPNPATRDKEITCDFDNVLRICRDHSISLPPLEEYWVKMWASFGASLEKNLDSNAKRALQQVRSLGRLSKNVPALPASAGLAWKEGFSDLFGSPHFDANWEERMALATHRAILTGEEVVMLTRRIQGRNLHIHRAGDSDLRENKPWILHAQPSGSNHQQVLCVYDRRNLIDRWTTRFDHRLPGSQGKPLFPFCQPKDWWKKETVAWRTISSKPAWLDEFGNGWARPNIKNGAGYHWDVFITDSAIQKLIGLEQINVVQFGAPSEEGQAGHIHHVPANKKGKLTGSGWPR